MQIEFWYWWVAALVMGSIEAIAPGSFFIWLGTSAAVVGFVALLLPDLHWQSQFLAFGVLALLTVAVSRFYIRRHPVESADPTLNRRGAQYIGRMLVLESPIVNGRGRAIVGDTLWTVEGDDLPVGSVVKVVGTDGILLKVEPSHPTT